MASRMRIHNDGMMLFGLPNRCRVTKPVPRNFKERIVLAALLAMGGVHSASAAQASVTLAWNSSPDPSIAGYHLYQGGASGVYTNMIPTQTTNVTVTNLVVRGTYYFAVTAYDVVGLESPYSSEIQYTVPVSNAPPVLLTGCRRLPTGNYS